MIQHGSLSFSVDAERHLGVFTDPPVTPAAFRERVVGMEELVEVERADAVAAVEADGSWTDAELERAEELAAEKYRDEEWIRTRPGSAGS